MRFNTLYILSVNRFNTSIYYILIFLFKTFDAKPTAIPDDPFNNIVGIIGKKYLGSIDSPSSSIL
jgi:hypothetical protein